MSTESLEQLISTAGDNQYFDEDFVVPDMGTPATEEDKPIVDTGTPNTTTPDLDDDPGDSMPLDNSTSTDPVLDPEPDSKPDETSIDKTTPEGIQEYYNFLTENNLLAPNEDFTFDGSSKSLSEALEQTNTNQQKAVAMSLWEQLPEDFRPLLQYGLSGGTNVKDFLDTYSQDTIDVTTADLDDPQTQDELVREYYRQTTKHSDEKIEKLVSLLKAKGEVDYTSEVYDIAVELKDIQKQNREELTRQAVLQKQYNETKLKEERDELFNTIDNLDLAPQRKGMIKSFVYANDRSSASRMDSTIQSIINNKEHFAQLADLLLDYDSNKGFQIENRFTKKSKTNALNDLEKRLSEKFSDSKSKVSGSHSTSGSDNFDWGAIFSQQSE